MTGLIIAACVLAALVLLALAAGNRLHAVQRHYPPVDDDA